MTVPKVRVAVLNFNGGDFTLQCLEHLRQLDWPKDRLEVLVVDNASTDGSPGKIRELFGEVKLVDAGRNRGFAGGNNLALEDLAGIDYVALLNNDAFVEPGWLGPLVEKLESDESLGAANSKILFAFSFIDVVIESPVFEPGTSDTRKLGVRVSGVGVDGEDRWRKSQFITGFYGVEHGDGEEEIFQWTGPRATLRVPTTRGRDSGGPTPREVPVLGSQRVSRANPDLDLTCELRLSAEKEKTIKVTCGDEERTFIVGPAPTWVKVGLSGAPYDVINNAGSRLVEEGYGADRGFLQRDEGPFDEEADVFAWCGCSVLLSKRYLEDAGLLDERLFLYYEDFDLSWRGQRLGWRYAYVPKSLVRHFHTATSVEDSDLFRLYVHRNRLLVLVKNAPAEMALRASAAYLYRTIRVAFSEIALPALRGRRPSPHQTIQRMKVMASFLRLVPSFFVERRRLAKRQKAGPRELMSWMEPQ